MEAQVQCVLQGKDMTAAEIRRMMKTQGGVNTTKSEINKEVLYPGKYKGIYHMTQKDIHSAPVWRLRTTAERRQDLVDKDLDLSLVQPAWREAEDPSSALSWRGDKTAQDFSWSESSRSKCVVYFVDCSSMCGCLKDIILRVAPEPHGTVVAFGTKKYALSKELSMVFVPVASSSTLGSVTLKDKYSLVKEEFENTLALLVGMCYRTYCLQTIYDTEYKVVLVTKNAQVRSLFPLFSSTFPKIQHQLIQNKEEV